MIIGTSSSFLIVSDYPILLDKGISFCFSPLLLERNGLTRFQISWFEIRQLMVTFLNDSFNSLFPRATHLFAAFVNIFIFLSRVLLEVNSKLEPGAVGKRQKRRESESVVKIATLCKSGFLINVPIIAQPIHVWVEQERCLGVPGNTKKSRQTCSKKSLILVAILITSDFPFPNFWTNSRFWLWKIISFFILS